MYQFRSATAQDVDAVLPLIYSSGPQAIDYAFACQGQTSHDFLRFAFTDGKGHLGYRNHTVAVLDGQVQGVAAFYNLSDYLRLTLEHLGQLWRFYPVRHFLGLLLRGHHLQSVMPPPGPQTHYVAHFGVSPAFRGKGIGTALLDYQQGVGRAQGRSHYAIDVSVDNPRAQALYARYGFSLQAENPFSGPPGAVPHGRRLTMPL
jgi:ribosomal protein S18 acetylase RimI-like enzyme